MAKKDVAWDPARAALFGCSRQGASHKANNTPCQDAWKTSKVRSKGGVNAVIIAAADGHGASVHDLSQAGSKLGVEAACEVLREFAKSLKKPRTSIDEQDIFRADIPKRIVDAWRLLVDEDAADRLTEAELDMDPQAIYYRYGTTLLAAMVTSEEIFLTSIGDGDIVLVRPDSTVAVHMDQDAPGLTGSMTFSLASQDPEILFQTKILDREDGGLLTISTDGLIKSFQNKDYFWEFTVAIQERVRADGFQDTVLSLPDILDYVSLHGSGDDMTFVSAWIEDEPLEDEELLETHHSITLRDEERLEMDGMGKTQYGSK